MAQPLPANPWDTPFGRRYLDAETLLPMPPTPYADGIVARLKDEGLIESVPYGAQTEGGGVLISYTRLRFELETARAAGAAGLT